MRVLWTVFSKEFLDILRDRRRFILSLLTMFIIFPLFMIVPYAYLLTRAAKQQMDVLLIAVRGVDHAPVLIDYLAHEKDIHAVAVDDVETLVNSKQYPIGLIIPEDYEEKINGGNSAELILVTDMRRSSSVITSRLQKALAEYGTELTQTRLEGQGLSEDFVTPLSIKKKNAATSTETAGSLLALIIPGAIVSIALTAGMPIAVSAIAGEKKKLTLEPVLFTTVSRFQLVFAKLLAVIAGVLISLISLGIAFIGMLALAWIVMVRNLPMDKVAAAAKRAADSSTANPLAGGYHLDPLAIVLFFLAPFLIILLGAAFQILVSTWARNDEEASTYLTPLSLFSGLIMMATLLLDDFIPELWHYAVPVFGTILSMRDLLSNKIDPVSLTVMFTTSTLYALFMVALAGWMFNREEVVFRT